MLINTVLLWQMIKVSICVFIGGFLYCWAVWELCEWDYKKDREEKKDE